jgi:signal transduction histidine kinase
MSGPSIILAPPVPELLDALRSHGCDVETAADGYRVVELAPRVHPAVLIASVGLPGPEPPELVRRTKAVVPDCRVIILGARRREDAAALLRAGCDAALSADPDPRYLLWTLGRVLVGGVVLSPDLARGLVETLAESVHREQEWARSLADRTRQAEVLARAKADFLGNVSHELRTPLTIIKGVASLLRRVDAPDDREELLEQVERAADRLTAMVDDLLTMAEVEGGTLALDVSGCDLAPLLAEEASSAATRHPSISVNPRIPDAVPTEADAPRIREVVRHLLENACRYSRPGESVTVRARVSDEGVTVSVTDRGEGVDRSQVSAAFGQPFAPGEDPMTKERAGLGIGLNLARNIIGLHGGILWAEPLPGGGSRVSFTLPPPRPAQAEEPAAGPPATANTSS